MEFEQIPSTDKEHEMHLKALKKANKLISCQDLICQTTIFKVKKEFSHSILENISNLLTLYQLN